MQPVYVRAQRRGSARLAACGSPINANPEGISACEHRGARWRAGLERVEGIKTDAAPRQSVEAWCDEARVDVSEIIVPEVVGHNVHKVDMASCAPSTMVRGRTTCGHTMLGIVYLLCVIPARSQNRFNSCIHSARPFIKNRAEANESSGTDRVSSPASGCN